MSIIHLTSFISAPIDRVFDLSRNLTIYKNVFQNRNEKFSSGAGSTLVSHGETISFHAKHGGKIRVVTLRITAMERPYSYTEEQVKGDLEYYKHDHHFKTTVNGTIMIDIIDFAGPKDFIGKFFGRIYFKRYVEVLVRKRNEVIRQYAETEKWIALLT